MPSETQLKIDDTFENQKNLINVTIVPTVMRTLDKNMYPVSETIVYNMIHSRHKHQREEYLNKQQPVAKQSKKARKKHLTSRRNDVSNEPVLFSSVYYSYYFYYFI